MGYVRLADNEDFSHKYDAYIIGYFYDEGGAWFTSNERYFLDEGAGIEYEDGMNFFSY